jgi:hypothetical protein
MLHAPLLAGEGGSPSPIRLRVLSLGAGVQSTTMALLAAHGEIGPMPDCAIFADTGWEPRAVCRATPDFRIKIAGADFSGCHFPKLASADCQK